MSERELGATLKAAVDSGLTAECYWALFQELGTAIESDDGDEEFPSDSDQE